MTEGEARHCGDRGLKAEDRDSTERARRGCCPGPPIPSTNLQSQGVRGASGAWPRGCLLPGPCPGQSVQAEAPKPVTSPTAGGDVLFVAAQAASVRSLLQGLPSEHWPYSRVPGLPLPLANASFSQGTFSLKIESGPEPQAGRRAGEVAGSQTGRGPWGQGRVLPAARPAGAPSTQPWRWPISWPLPGALGPALETCGRRLGQSCSRGPARAGPRDLSQTRRRLPRRGSPALRAARTLPRSLPLESHATGPWERAGDVSTRVPAPPPATGAPTGGPRRGASPGGGQRRHQGWAGKNPCSVTELLCDQI